MIEPGFRCLGFIEEPLRARDWVAMDMLEPVMTTNDLGIASLGYVIVFVRDMDRSITFYRDVLGLTPKMITPYWSEFALFGTTLALHGADESYGPAPKPSADPGAKKGVALEVVFQTADPMGANAELAKRGIPISKPKMVHEAGDHVGVSSVFEDPDGNLLSVYGLVPNAFWAGT